MRPGVKVLMPLLAIVGLAGIGMGVSLLAERRQVGELTRQLQLSQQRAAELEASNQELNRQFGTFQTERTQLEGRLSAVRTQLSSVTADLERARKELEGLTTQYGQLSHQRTELQTQVATLTREREEAKQGVRQLEQSNANLERSVSRLRERLVLLDRDYRQVVDKLASSASAVPSSQETISLVTASTRSPASSEGQSSASTVPGAVELPPIVVRKDHAGMAAPIRGRVLEVNEPHSFVVMDRGSQDGVQVGMVFDLLRGTTSVGRASVIRVRPELSACEILRAKTRDPLQVGDVAVQSSP